VEHADLFRGIFVHGLARRSAIPPFVDIQIDAWKKVSAGKGQDLYIEYRVVTRVRDFFTKVDFEESLCI
jgi:hypothetical protein